MKFREAWTFREKLRMNRQRMANSRAARRRIIHYEFVNYRPVTRRKA